MLSFLVRFSVHHRGVVLTLAVGVLVYSAVGLTRARYDVFPEFAPARVAVQTEAPGFVPEQVELLVTKPLEDALNGVTGIASIRSESIQGLSVITAVFDPGTDIFRARQAVAERITEVSRNLPGTVRPPVLSPLTSSTGTVLVLGITSASRSLRDQRTFADWTIKPALLAIPGVGRVAIWGGEVRQLQVLLDPARLRAYGLSVTDVVAAARQATGVRGAGVLDNTNERIVLRTDAQLASPRLLAQSVVRAGPGGVLRLGDLGRVADGAEPRIGAGGVNGGPGVVVSIDAQLGANVRDVARAVERTLEELRPAIAQEGLTLHPDLFRPTTFIDLALHNVTNSLLVGGVLVAAVLILFLGHLRTAAASLIAIPLSLFTAVGVIELLGLSINTLTLGGLAIAIGEVVDDAIIDVENIARRLRENAERGRRRTLEAVALDASLEVRSSVVYATFVVALVFVPVTALTGVQGAIFRPLAVAFILAILASLLVAMTVTPAVTLTLLGTRAEAQREPQVLVRMKRGYARMLFALQRHSRGVVVTVLVLVLVAIGMTPFFTATFLPAFREGHFQVHMWGVPGTSLDESLRMGNAVTHALRADPRVRSVAQRAGRAELSEDTWGTYYSEMEVDLEPLHGRAAETIESDLRARLASFPGMNFTLRPLLTERIEEIVTGETAPVVVKLFGHDLDSLDRAARQVESMARAIPGAADVAYTPPAVAPEVLIRFRPAAMAQFGVTAGEGLEAVSAAIAGEPVAQVFEGNRATDVVVLLDPELVRRPEDLGSIPLRSADGRLVPLSQVAAVARAVGRDAINHDGARRVQTVQMSPEGRDVTSFTDDVERRIKGLHLPSGVYSQIGGTAVERRAAEEELIVRSLLVTAAIMILLALAFGSAGRLLLVLANMPFALVGGVVAVALSGGRLSLGSLVGFVTLFGISARNSIMLVSHYDYLVGSEQAPWGPETAVRGAAERLGPILMTALVTGLALMPLVIGSGDPGREIEGPLATVIVGGLVTSTVLNLFVLPTLALQFGNFAPSRSADAPEPAP